MRGAGRARSSSAEERRAAALAARWTSWGSGGARRRRRSRPSPSSWGGSAARRGPRRGRRTALPPPSAGREEALAAAREELEELSDRLSEAEEAPGEEEPDTSVRDRLAADGANARQTEMEARLQVRTHEERVKGLGGPGRRARPGGARRARGPGPRRAAPGPAGLRGGGRRGGARRAPRGLLAHVEVSLARAEDERAAAEQARAEREAELAAARRRGRELKARARPAHRRRAPRRGAGRREAAADRAAGGEGAGGARHGTGRARRRVRPRPAGAAVAARRGRDLPEDPEDRATSRGRTRRAEQEKRLKAAEKAYQQLGKVNPLALEEFAALEERHKFLTEQLEDLRKTRADLLQVVKEVDERVEQVFTAAYHDTAREFEGVFSRLFPGGEGRLILTDPDNMLTTGVEVEARPPGQEGQAAVAAVRRRAVADRGGACWCRSSRPGPARST